MAVYVNPSSLPVWRAIIGSSLVGITQTETLLCGPEIRGPWPRWPRIKFDSQPCSGFADSPADLGRVFTNAGSENQPVDTAKNCCQSANLLRRAVDEVVHGEACFRLAPVEKIAHVITDSGNPQQAGFFVENIFYLLYREFQVLKEIEDDTGIDASRPCAHAQSIHRREAHARVYTLPSSRHTCWHRSPGEQR
jgi:hypothetical protein